MSKFEEMTNAELKEACEDFGLDVLAKNPGKPNKAEYLEVLNTFKAKQDAIHGVEEGDKVEPVADTKPKKQSKSALLKLDLMAKERVIVHDNQEGQTKDEMISVSWGNRLIGRHTDWVRLDGEPQYVRRGALNNLKDATTVIHVPKPFGGVSMQRKNRFVVVPVEPLTDKELENLAAQQRARNSKVA